MKVCVLGIGEVGLPTAKYVRDRGLEVWGYDVNPAAIKTAKKQGILNATINWHEVPSADAYIICVSTTLKSDLPDLSSVFDACEKVYQKTPSSLVSIESTVMPGTSRKIYEKIFKKSINLVHVPHRYWSGDPIRHGVKQIRVIGGVNIESHDVGVNFYKALLKIPLRVVSSIEVAEMTKIVENSYRYIQIAHAEELKMICEELGFDFDELRNACNTKWNIEIPQARDGIRSHCLPKDVRYLVSMSTHNLLSRSAITVDAKYREWLSKKYVLHNR